MLGQFHKSKILPDLNLNFFQLYIEPLIKDSIVSDLFLEEEMSYTIIMENGKIIKNIKNYLKGLSLRKLEEKFYLFSSTEVHLNTLIKIINQFQSLINFNKNNNINLKKNIPLISTNNFNEIYNSEENFYDYKILLNEINTYLNKKNYISNLIITINYEKNHREIFNEKIEVVEKIHNLWSLRMNLTLTKDNKFETFYRSISNKESIDFLKKNWQRLADELWHDCYELFEAQFIPAGNYTILCAPGDAGTIFHEAVGHALESDLLFTNNSCFTNKQNHKIAASIVTVVDDGTIPQARGTIEYDDEGTPAKKNILIEKGLFVGELNNKIYAYKTQKKPSGNGRREHFNCQVIPRMTNTYLEAGTDEIEDILKTIKSGIYVKFIGGGQVDTAVGSFVFEGKISYIIKDGKITTPLKEVMLMGNCMHILNNITHISKDLSLCHSGGYCGKDGQMVPVTVGGPFFLINNVTIGGK